MRTEYLSEDMPIGFYIRVKENGSRAGIWFSGNSDLRAQSEYYFNCFSEMKDDFELSFGRPLNWEQRGVQRYIHWDNPDSYGYTGDDSTRQAEEADAIASAMRGLIAVVNKAMSAKGPYCDT